MNLPSANPPTQSPPLSSAEESSLVITTFKIERAQHAFISTAPYNRDGSLLIRLLLTHYIKGDLPIVEKSFNEEKNARKNSKLATIIKRHMST
jgi:hypothetical protein